ncbi:hypothetical protein [Bdellovibrio sp. HCB288]|uniref:hypothetical protein n=1 Tax=Bdellovibrio sp. HCB288 TaxID=3394355 RepID=UPI0039B50821
MKVKVLGMIVAAALLAPQSGFGQDDPKIYENMEKTGPHSMEGTQAIEVEAKVIEVNRKTREITLKPKDGESMTVKVGDEVRNFDKINRGDMLRIRYLESLALELKKQGTAENMRDRSAEIVRSKPGQKPGGMVVEKVSAIGTITNVDKKKKNVTIKGPERSVTVQVQDKSILDQLKKGDQIEIEYTQAMAVSVETIKR